MESQEIEAKTKKLLEELMLAEPINFSVSADMAYWMFVQLQLASEHPCNHTSFIPESVIFVKQLHDQILKRCSPETVEFLKSVR